MFKGNPLSPLHFQGSRQFDLEQYYLKCGSWKKGDLHVQKIFKTIDFISKKSWPTCNMTYDMEAKRSMENKVLNIVYDQIINWEIDIY